MSNPNTNAASAASDCSHRSGGGGVAVPVSANGFTAGHPSNAQPASQDASYGRMIALSTPKIAPDGLRKASHARMSHLRVTELGRYR